MRIVASLTTIPRRIWKIRPVIECLLKQTCKLDKIYVNVPYESLKGEKYRIPSFLYAYKDVEIIRCKDYGPITKLLPVLDVEKDHDTYIITFDDDVIIHKDVVEIFRRRIKKYPDCILSFSGWCISSFPMCIQFYNKREVDIEVDWIQGCHGICYLRKMLDRSKILDFMDSLPGFMVKHDDHIISGYLAQNNIKKIVLKEDAYKYFSFFSNSAIDSISGLQTFQIEVIRVCLLYYRKGLYFRDPDRVKNYIILFSILGLLYLYNVYGKEILAVLVILFSRTITWYIRKYV